jgi:hypothetical protein
MSYEVDFVPGTRRPARARWSQRMAFDVDGLQSDGRLVREYVLDWARAEGCQPLSATTPR